MGKMPEKQLELSKRNAFFKDPFFQDLRSGLDDGLEKRLAEFSARSLGLSGAGLGEAAHNIQVSASNDKFMIQLELPGLSPEDFSLKTKDDVIIIEAKHNAKTEDGPTDTRQFTKEFKMPSGVATDQLGSTYSGAGILTISAPRAIAAPEGAQVSEAMKAQSQAYVTDDGVAVKKDDKASSQSIAATTQSEDGSTISSFKSSSSSMMSSEMLGGMPPMRGMQMPQMGGFDMPGLSFREMPDMPLPSGGAGPQSQPEYTVTSPPMSPPPPPEMNHKVQKTEDYVPPSTSQTAEATVLLKVKEGDEYKLALNMQQYSPEDITIKLNGQELTIEAASHGEKFSQKHIIPDNINLDAMSSSFSSDGVLVVKAPKK